MSGSAIVKVLWYTKDSFLLSHTYSVWNERWAMDLNIGDIIRLKKPHPCGSHEWEILRVGMDFRLKCQGCGHMIMIPRKQVEKKIKQVKKP